MAWILDHSQSHEVVHEQGYQDRRSYGLIDCNICLRHKRYRWSKIGVIYRDTKEQVLSHANHFAHKGMSDHDYHQHQKHHLPGYYCALDELLRDGAQLIRYDRFGDQGYIEQLARDFGIHDLNVNRNTMRARINSHPPRYSSFRHLPQRVREEARNQEWFDQKYGSTNQ